MGRPIDRKELVVEALADPFSGIPVNLRRECVAISDQLTRHPIDCESYEHYWVGYKSEIREAAKLAIKSPIRLLSATEALCQHLGEPIVVILRDAGVAVIQPGGKMSRVIPDASTGEYRHWRDNPGLKDHLNARLSLSSGTSGDFVTRIRGAFR